MKQGKQDLLLMLYARALGFYCVKLDFNHKDKEDLVC